MGILPKVERLTATYISCIRHFKTMAHKRSQKPSGAEPVGITSL